MNTEAFRAAVTAEIVAWRTANFPDIPAFYEGGPTPDQDKIGMVWVDVEFRWYGGQIASMGKKPRTRHTGAVAIDVYFREAAGVQLPGAVVDSIGSLLEARRIGAGILWAPQRTIPTDKLGWKKTGLLVPFTLG